MDSGVGRYFHYSIASLEGNSAIETRIRGDWWTRWSYRRSPVVVNSLCANRLVIALRLLVVDVVIVAMEVGVGRLAMIVQVLVDQVGAHQQLLSARISSAVPEATGRRS